MYLEQMQLRAQAQRSLLRRRAMIMTSDFDTRIWTTRNRCHVRRCLWPQCHHLPASLRTRNFCAEGAVHSDLCRTSAFLSCLCILKHFARGAALQQRVQCGTAASVATPEPAPAQLALQHTTLTLPSPQQQRHATANTAAGQRRSRAGKEVGHRRVDGGKLEAEAALPRPRRHRPLPLRHHLGALAEQALQPRRALLHDMHSCAGTECLGA